MKWPPVPVGGRLPFVVGAEATTILLLQTLSDLQTNPFNPINLSLGDVTFKSESVARTRIENATDRLRSIIFIDEVNETGSEEDALDGSREYTVQFTDRETRIRSEVTING